MSSHYVPHTKVPTLVFPTSTQAARHVALMIESLIRQNNSAGRPTVLGLPTGSTPVGLYRELIRLHREAGLDFSRVVTFNLDEYYPMTPDDAAQLPPLDARDVFQPRQHRRRRTSTSPTAPSRLDEVEDYCLRYEQQHSPGRRHRPADAGHRPHRATSASTSPARRGTAAPGWSRSTR